MLSTVFSIFFYALVMTVTPGPNNMALTASGAQFGYRKTLPLGLGIFLGVLSILVLSAIGLGFLFDRYPVIQKINRIVGSAYLLFIAVKIALSNSIWDEKTDRKKRKPLGLWHGLALQFVNPKAYVMSITAMSVYSIPDRSFIFSAAIIILIFCIVVPLSFSLWTGFGTIIGKLFVNAQYRQNFFIGLGVLTMASVVFIWI